MRVLLDTDVVLDLLLDRAGFADNAAAIWKANEQGQIDAYISAITPVNVFYIARKIKGTEKARQAVAELLAAFHVCTLDYATLQAALSLPMTDYEDAVQLASAVSQQLDAVITRNVDDYKNATLPVLTPSEFLTRLTS